MAEKSGTYLRFNDLKADGIVNNRTTLHRWLNAGLFPHPVALGPNSVGWLQSEIEAWKEERARRRNEDRENRRAAFRARHGQAVAA